MRERRKARRVKINRLTTTTHTHTQPLLLAHIRSLTLYIFIVLCGECCCCCCCTAWLPLLCCVEIQASTLCSRARSLSLALSLYLPPPNTRYELSDVLKSQTRTRNATQRKFYASCRRRRRRRHRCAWVIKKSSSFALACQFLLYPLKTTKRARPIPVALIYTQIHTHIVTHTL